MLGTGLDEVSLSWNGIAMAGLMTQKGAAHGHERGSMLRLYGYKEMVSEVEAARAEAMRLQRGWSV